MRGLKETPGDEKIDVRAWTRYFWGSSRDGFDSRTAVLKQVLKKYTHSLGLVEKRLCEFM